MPRLRPTNLPRDLPTQQHSSATRTPSSLHLALSVLQSQSRAGQSLLAVQFLPLRANASGTPRSSGLGITSLKPIRCVCPCLRLERLSAVFDLEIQCDMNPKQLRAVTTSLQTSQRGPIACALRGSLQPRGLLAAPGCYRMSQPIQRVSTCCFVSGSVRRQGSQEVTNHSERRRAVQADSQVAQWRKDRWMRKGSAVSKTSRSAARVTFAWSDNSGPYPRRGAARAPATVRARRAGSAKTDSTNSPSSATSMPGGKHESCQNGSLTTRFTGKHRIQRCSELASRPPIATAQRPVSSQSRSTMAVLPLSSGRCSR